jgi:flagellar capping protein FliD
MYFGGALDAIGDVFGGVMDALNPFGMVGDLVGDVLGGVAGGLGGILGGGIGGIFDTATGLLDNLMPGNLFGGLGDIVGNLFGEPTGQPPQISILNPFPMEIGGMFMPGLQALGPAMGVLQQADPGAVSQASSGGGNLDTLMSQLASKTDSMYSNLENQINNLDPESDTYQKDLQNIQLAMSKYTQMTELLSNLQKDLHEMSMSIIRNIKG